MSDDVALKVEHDHDPDREVLVVTTQGEACSVSLQNNVFRVSAKKWSATFI